MRYFRFVCLAACFSVILQCFIVLISGVWWMSVLAMASMEYLGIDGAGGDRVSIPKRS